MRARAAGSILLVDRLDLVPWHPLVTGDRAQVHAALAQRHDRAAHGVDEPEQGEHPEGDDGEQPDDCAPGEQQAANPPKASAQATSPPTPDRIAASAHMSPNAIK